MPRTIKVEGIPKMKAALAKKAAELQAGAIAAVEAEVKETTDDAKGEAPVKTGELRDSIAGEASGTDGTVRATARHAKFVELGTYKDSPQPFMHPAAERTRRRLPETAAAIIRKALGA